MRKSRERADHDHDRALDHEVAAGKATRSSGLPVQRKAASGATGVPALLPGSARPAPDALDFGYAKAVQLKEDAAAAVTDTKPVEDDSSEALLISFPDFLIDTESPLGKVGGLGHAGVLLIRKDGLTKYYEFGRYATTDGTKGKVRNKSVPNVTIGPDGLATKASLEAVLAKISAQSGQGGRLDAAYFQNVDFAVMEAYAQAKLKESNPEYKKDYKKDRSPYELKGNNCATFAEDVITQDQDVDKPSIWLHSPINTVEEYQDEGNAKVGYDPAADKGERLSIGAFDEADAKVKK